MTEEQAAPADATEAPPTPLQLGHQASVIMRRAQHAEAELLTCATRLDEAMALIARQQQTIEQLQQFVEALQGAPGDDDAEAPAVAVQGDRRGARRGRGKAAH